MEKNDKYGVVGDYHISENEKSLKEQCESMFATDRKPNWSFRFAILLVFVLGGLLVYRHYYVEDFLITFEKTPLRTIKIKQCQGSVEVLNEKGEVVKRLKLSPYGLYNVDVHIPKGKKYRARCR